MSNPTHTAASISISLAANYDPDLVSELAKFPVAEVYGKLPKDIAGGGRPTYMSGRLAFNQLADYVATLNEHDIQFNYLLNSSCLGNREWSSSWQRSITRLLRDLREIGISSFTVSTPYLLKLIKRRFPDCRCRVGIYAQVDTPRRARFWRDIGADAITLESFSINRDFQRLEQIREAVDCDLHLIANHCCLPNCAMQSYHQNGFAHASSETERLFLDYCFFRCTHSRLHDPSNFIKSAWIRPEDIPFYAKLGYTHIKLTERDLPSAELLKRTKAYATARFSGNLAELLLHTGLGQREKRDRIWMFKNFFKPRQLSPFKMFRLQKIAAVQGMLGKMQELPVYIDNTQIPNDFLEGFRKRNCSVLKCADCQYCEEIAARAVRINEDYRVQCCDQLEQLESQILEGRLWNV